MKKSIAVLAAALLAPLLVLPALALVAQASRAGTSRCADSSMRGLVTPPQPDNPTNPGASTGPSQTDPCSQSVPSASVITDQSADCSVSDPSGSGGCVTPTMAAVMQQVEQRFGHLPVSCWSARGGDPYSDHPKGRACDYTFGRIGTYPGAVDVARGWSLANWLRANAAPLHVAYVIWQGRIWSRARDAEDWRPYTGGGHYPTNGPTYGHFDHVHASTVD